MRKVLYKLFIELKWKNSIEGDAGHPTRHQIKGSGDFEKEFKHEGLFHGWGVAYEEFETGAGNFTIALIEKEDGTIEEVLPCNIKFIK